MGKKLYVLLISCMAVILVFSFADFQIGGSEQTSRMIKDIIMRLYSGICFSVIAWKFGYRLFGKAARPYYKLILFLLPCIAVSVNNFPFLAAAGGTAVITSPRSDVLIFALECLSVGFFEEVIFRGIILLILLKGNNSRSAIFKAVIFSSAIFAFAHIFNIFAGAGVGPTILQVGYSFLTGCMWAVVFLYTGNILYCVALHALYNFGGMLYLQVGIITGMWDVYTVIITVVLSVVAALHLWRVLIKLAPERADRLFYLPPEGNRK